MYQHNDRVSDRVGVRLKHRWERLRSHSETVTQGGRAGLTWEHTVSGIAGFTMSLSRVHKELVTAWIRPMHKENKGRPEVTQRVSRMLG